MIFYRMSNSHLTIFLHTFIFPDTAPPEAFEIPFDDDGTNGLIKKHPPKRLQRLEEQANTLAPPTIEDLEEKLATAEMRRKEVSNYFPLLAF